MCRKKISENDLNGKIELHQSWIEKEHGGERADFSEMEMQGVDLSRVCLAGALFYKTDLKGANLSGADLRLANFVEADLSWADLSGADLRGVDFRRTDLREADLSDAHMKETWMTGARYEGAQYRRAQLQSWIEENKKEDH